MELVLLSIVSDAIVSYTFRDISKCIALCITGSENECNDGDVRLVDGAIEQDGRPEVCFIGIWLSICRFSWNTIVSYMFCKTLGYDGPSNVIYVHSLI